MTSDEFNDSVIGCTEFLKGYAMYLSRNSEQAKDLIQDTIVRALVNKDKIYENTNMKAWLYTIMKNIYINNYWQSKKIDTITEINDYKNVKAGSAVSYNDGISNIDMAYLNKELDNLSSMVRIPFMMYYTGFKYEEIATKLKLPIGTIKSRIFFARKEMRKRLNKNDRYAS